MSVESQVSVKSSNAPSPSESSAPASRRLLAPTLATALLGLTLLLVLARLTPPAPRPLDAAADTFSAKRAHATLLRLLPTSEPHPVASRENAAVRRRLIAELRALELEPTLQTTFECGRYGVCAPVVNVIATMPGESARTIALMAHYDSVPAGPGAADDGAAVASILEIARALQSGPLRRHTVALVFTEGEEVGLLGARAFVRDHPLFGRIDTVINLEARGIRGPSTLFRTSADATRLIAAYDVRRPVASSLAREIFARLPSETDLSQVIAGGASGYDLAFLGGATAYHTELDSTDNVSQRSIQHQGDNALELLRSLDARALPDVPLRNTTSSSANPRPAVGDQRAADNQQAVESQQAAENQRQRAVPVTQGAVYFDVLALVLVWWPENATAPLAWSTGLLLLLGVGGLWWRQRVTGVGVVLGIVLWLALVVGVGIVALAGHLVLRHAGALPFVWVAHPAVLHAGLGALALGGTLAVAWVGRELGQNALLVGGYLGWGGLALATALNAPGASYLPLVPAACGALGLVTLAVVPSGRRTTPWVEAVPTGIAGILWWPVVAQLYTAIGFVALPVNAILVALVVGLLAPALSHLDVRWLRWGLGGCALFTLTTLVTALVVPSTTPDAPRWCSIAYHEHETTSAQWLLDTSFGTPSAPLRSAASFEPAAEHPWPGAFSSALSAPAQPLGIASPEVTVVRREVRPHHRELDLLVRSRRGSRVISVHSPRERSVTVAFNGRFATPLLVGGQRVVVCFGVPAGGIRVTLSVHDDPPWSGLVVDHLPGLPEGADFLEQRRDPGEVPAHFGDSTLASTTISL